MSIRQIVTRGIGPGGSVAGIVTSGFLAAGGDVSAPVISSATIWANGTTFTMVFNESVVANITTGFAVTLTGGAAAITYASGSGSSTLVYTLSRTVYQGETGTLAYTQPGNGIEDSSGNDLATFSGQSIVNNSSQVSDVTAPTVSSATINSAGAQITFALSESVTFGAGGNSGFSLSLSGGAVTATYASGSGSSALVYALSRPVQEGETGTHAYTQPGNGVEDSAGNDLATYSGASVTNNSTYDPSDLGPGGVIFTVPARTSRNPGPVYGLQTTAGEITKVNVAWSPPPASEGADVESVSWSVASGNITLSTPTTTDNQSIINITTPSNTLAYILITATFTDGQKDVVYIKVRTKAYRN